MQSESPNPQPVKMRHNFYNFCPLVVRLLLFLLWQNLKMYDKQCKLIVSWVFCVVWFSACVLSIEWNAILFVEIPSNLSIERPTWWRYSYEINNEHRAHRFFSLLLNSFKLNFVFIRFASKKSKAEKKILISFFYLFNLAFQFNAYCCCTLSRSRITLHTHAVWVRSMKV